MNQQEASKRISEILNKIQNLTDEAKKIADEHDISFTMDVDGVYGTGADYWNGSWSASSQSC